MSGAAFAAEYQPGEVIVKYKPEAVRTRALMNQMYDSAGVQKVKRFTGMMSGMERLVLADNVKVEDAIAELEKNDAVEYVQPNYILHAYPVSEGSENAADDASEGTFAMAPVPCMFPGVNYPPGCAAQQSGGGQKPALKPAPADVNPPVADPDLAQTYGMNKIAATTAWNTFKGSKSFIVAVIDTGADYNHKDLSFNMWRNPKPTDKQDVVGFDFVHNDGLPYDDNRHGTHTAGTVGAVGGNGVGVSGVAQRVSIMALKFLSGEGSGTTADAVRAIDYAVGHGAKVLSNSWGGKGDQGNKVLSDAIERARTKDVLFVAAAGNDSGNNDDPKQADYPAALKNDNIIAVAATDSNDSLAKFSNYGAKSVHVAAPGVNIYSTIPGDRYSMLTGTSMACPHVAGAAALVWAKNPTWNYQKVKAALMSTADMVPSLKGKTITGGRINVLKAMNARFPR
ncbi:MAG: S8 family peptidase [Bdellovibrionia bacterium]